MQTLAILFLALPAFQEPRPIATQIRDVTVFADRALVHRVVELPAGGGVFVVSGLPLSADPEQVRVRCTGGDVTGVDVTEVRQPRMPDARREELRRQLVELERELGALEDERETLKSSLGAVYDLMTLDAQKAKPELIGGKLDLNAWAKGQDALLARLRQQKEGMRELAQRRAEVERQLDELRQALGTADVAGGAMGRQVELEVVAAGPSVLEVEYVVSNAGWHPIYDLRAAADAKSVELVYRADVYQHSGEDWNDVDVALSTAQPQVGAQGPEPQPSWVRLFDPRPSPNARASAATLEAKDEEGSLKRFGYAGVDADAPASPAPRPFASVESQGLSVRFRLPRRETLTSRKEPTRVLVAQQRLAVAAEYLCTPALDTNVWLRGKAKNSTEWTILPGRAAVYFGADFLGHAQLAAVQPGEEFTLHLGRDPGLTLERVQTEDLAKQPGVFGSRVTQVDGWRVKLKNTGALVGGADATATVHVREALPRATDDRIKVELAEAKPEPSTDERWKKDREEQGFVTWTVKVPRNGEVAITWKVKLSFPEGLRIAR